MSQENTDGKKSIGICLSMISCIFSFLKVYPSQCSALRMHTCGATMIHIITTFGDDSNQKPEVHPANNLKRPDSQRRDLHKVQLWESEARQYCIAYSSGKKCRHIYTWPLGQHIQEWKAQRLRETHSKSTNTPNKKEGSGKNWQCGSVDGKISLGLPVGVPSSSATNRNVMLQEAFEKFIQVL